MRAELEIEGARYRVDLEAPTTLCTPIELDGAPRGFERQGARSSERVAPAQAFHLPPATSTPVRAGSFVGDIVQGGSVNCRTLSLTPHGNGTHTESLQHVAAQAPGIDVVAPRGLIPASVVTVPTVSLSSSREAYRGQGEGDDQVIARSSLELARRAAAIPDAFLKALCLRLPSARPADGVWSGTNPPYFTEAAMELVVSWGVRHLLLEVPSVDREDDGGAVICHRIFWSVDDQRRATSPERAQLTITELIAVPDALEDGIYLLALHTPSIATDAVPSVPVLFEVLPA